jgi:hypothetical protein
MEIAAGEYDYTTDYLRRMLNAEAVDVQLEDVTRCCVYTGWLQAAALCYAYRIDLSGHCAPSLHLHVACAAPRFCYTEWVHDHMRMKPCSSAAPLSPVMVSFAPICRVLASASYSSVEMRNAIATAK